MTTIFKYKKASSLHDESGEHHTDIEVIDKSPFSVCSHPISEEDKPILEWKIQRLVSLGILCKKQH